MAIDVQPALSPHLVVDDANAAIDFYVKAFGAVEMGRFGVGFELKPSYFTQAVRNLKTAGVRKDDAPLLSLAEAL